MSTNEPADRRVARRWTPDLIVEGFTPVSDMFLEHYSELGLTSTEAMLIIQLMKHKWDKEHPYPSFGTLARRMGMTPTSVRNHARNLEKKGCLRRIHRQGSTNQFDLTPLFHKLEQLRNKIMGFPQA